MKRIPALGLFILMSINVLGQINMSDSTAQVIGYWSKNEKQSYQITKEKYKIKDSDTTSRELYKYIVDVAVVDSTADSYLIDWFYKDYEIQSENPLVQKLASVTKDLNIRIKTNELGVFLEIVNWEEVRDYILEGTRMLRNETKNIPHMDDLIKQLETVYSTKESIELGAVEEMQQFYTFHGAKYKLGEEYQADIKMPNLHGGEPFDTKATVWLDELNPVDNNYIIRMSKSVNTEQLTDATFNYLVKMAETLKIAGPKREDMPAVSNDTYTASRIHGSGWIVYSVITKETRAEGQTNVEEQIIELL